MLAENAKRLDELLAAIRAQSFDAEVSADKAGLGPKTALPVITVENAFKVAAQFLASPEEKRTEFTAVGWWNGKTAVWESGKEPVYGDLLFRPVPSLPQPDEAPK